MTEYAPSAVRVVPYSREAIRTRPGMFVGGPFPESIFASLLRSIAMASTPPEASLTLRFDEDTFSLRGRLQTNTWDDGHPAKLSLSFCDDVSVTVIGEEEVLSGTIDFAFVRGLSHDVPERPALPGLVGLAETLVLARPGLHVEVIDVASGRSEGRSCPGGVTERLQHITANRSISDANLTPFRVTGSTPDGVHYDLAWAWCQSLALSFEAVVNGHRTRTGGSHIEGLWHGVADVFRTLIEEQGYACARAIEGPDVPRNAALVCVVEAPNPQWGPATRDCLHDPRIGEIIREAVRGALPAQLSPRLDSRRPPWQLLGGYHRDPPWLEQLASALTDDPTELCPGDIDGVCAGSYGAHTLQRLLEDERT